MLIKRRLGPEFGGKDLLFVGDESGRVPVDGVQIFKTGKDDRAIGLPA